MGRFIVRYQDGDRFRWAELSSHPPERPGDVISVVPFLSEAISTSVFLAENEAGELSSGSALKIKAEQLLSPVTSDATIYAQGLNFQAHAEEARHKKRNANLIFGKASSSITGPYNNIVRPKEVQLLDYEVEYGIVMRRDLGAGAELSEETLGSAVAGVVLCNDVSARDTMFGASFLQWFRGKSYRTFCPIGPVLWLLEPREVSAAVNQLDLKLWVNGELRQHGTSDQLIFRPAETLTYIASTMDLRRGDLLMTGTPAGITAGATPRLIEILQTHLLADEIRMQALREEMTKGRPFLQPGDLVTATLSHANGTVLGSLANLVVDAQ
jgi:2-keto-4-pentenoate hydratase/2-oxohepta-3-ene-1,7-dioic acid hydratase in catechol pathway